MYRQCLVFCPITLLKVVLVYFNNGNFITYVITCLHKSCLVELLSHVIYAVLGCYNPPKRCSISCYIYRDTMLVIRSSVFQIIFKSMFLLLLNCIGFFAIYSGALLFVSESNTSLSLNEQVLGLTLALVTTSIFAWWMVLNFRQYEIKIDSKSILLKGLSGWKKIDKTFLLSDIDGAELGIDLVLFKEKKLVAKLSMVSIAFDNHSLNKSIKKILSSDRD